MLNEQVESVMAIAFELARIREEHGAQSGMYLSEVRALRAEAERLAAQSAPFKREDLTLAAVNCEHQIDADCVRLHRDPTKEGSALSQLVDRVVSAIEQSTAQPQRPTYCGTGHCSCVECVVEPQAVVPAPSEQAVPGQPSRMIERVGRDEASAIDAWNTRALLAEQAQEPKAEDAPSDDELKDLAHSAYEEAMSFGLSVDTFLRYFKGIRNRAAIAAERKAP